MEKTIDFAELEELKTQFNLLNEKLEKQQIINDAGRILRNNINCTEDEN